MSKKIKINKKPITIKEIVSELELDEKSTKLIIEGDVISLELDDGFLLTNTHKEKLKALLNRREFD